MIQLWTNTQDANYFMYDSKTSTLDHHMKLPPKFCYNFEIQTSTVARFSK